MKSILIVDDNISFMGSLKYSLENLGYKISTAFSGAEALEKFKKNNIDVVLTDINMPGLNGLELANEIRNSNVDINIVLMSGYDFPKGTEEFNRIAKPFWYKDLLELID